jgi:two-component system response regulator FlrC
VRELFNVLERAAIVANNGVIEPAHLMLEDAMSSLAEAPAERWMAGAQTRQETAAPEAPDAALSIGAMEEQLIFKTLKQVNDNRTRAARMLGISVRTLRNKLKQYREKECGEAI